MTIRNKACARNLTIVLSIVGFDLLSIVSPVSAAPRSPDEGGDGYIESAAGGADATRAPARPTAMPRKGVKILGGWDVPATRELPGVALADRNQTDLWPVLTTGDMKLIDLDEGGESHGPPTGRPTKDDAPASTETESSEDKIESSDGPTDAPADESSTTWWDLLWQTIPATLVAVAFESVSLFVRRRIR